MEFKVKDLVQYDSRGINQISDSDIDMAFLHYSNLKKLGYSDQINELSRPILKISFNGKSIYRKFKQGSSFGLGNEEISLLAHDKRLLGVKNIDNQLIEVKKANFLGEFLFYWNNPKQDLRFAMRSSVILFLLSILLSKVLDFITNW
jgi:hypothetical protein